MLDPDRLAAALGDLLRTPPPLELGHLRRPAVSVEQRLLHLRGLLARRAPFWLPRPCAGPGRLRLTEAVQRCSAGLELNKAP